MKYKILLFALIFAVLFVGVSQATIFEMLSTDTKPTSGNLTAGVRHTLYEIDTGIVYRWSGTAWTSLFALVTSSDIDTLTAAGAGTAMAVNGVNQMTCLFDAAGASLDIFFTVQGKVSVDGFGWFNLDSNGATNITATAYTDSTGIKTYKELADVDSIRTFAYAISTSDSLMTAFRVSGD